MRLSLLLLVLAACGSDAVPGCRTACGTIFAFEDSCADIQAQETRVLDTYEHRGLFKSEDACHALDYWTVQVKPGAEDEGGVWYSDEHEQVIAGLTDCQHGYVLIGSHNYRTNAYSHELVHVFEHCAPGHEGWTERHVYDAINEAKERVDGAPYWQLKTQ